MENDKKIILKLPKDIATYKKCRDIPVDYEIVNTIKYLWKNKIQTLGCCSGHGKENPSIVITDGYNDKEIKEIEKIILKVDKQKWNILQWRIKKVN